MTITPLQPLSLRHRVAVFLDLIKFAHSIFALPFALVATFFAFRQLSRAGVSLTWSAAGGRLALILLCMVTARTFAMTVNRLVDRRYDILNPRTAKRPSVTGLVSPVFMTLAIALTAALFTFATLLFERFYHNPWPMILAIPVLVWLALYSFTKRFTALCHFWLGISLAMAPVSAWIAIVPPQGPLLTVPVLLLAVAVLFWVTGFDILYALQDEQIDRAANLHSIPAALGRTRSLWLSRLCHALTILALALLGITGQFHILYYLGFAAAAILLIIEQSLVRPHDISRINLAFMTVNGLVGLVFGSLAILDTVLFR